MAFSVVFFFVFCFLVDPCIFEMDTLSKTWHGNLDSSIVALYPVAIEDGVSWPAIRCFKCWLFPDLSTLIEWCLITSLWTEDMSKFKHAENLIHENLKCFLNMYGMWRLAIMVSRTKYVSDYKREKDSWLCGSYDFQKRMWKLCNICLTHGNQRWSELNLMQTRN